jgi:predicted dehydrogenase
MTKYSCVVIGLGAIGMGYDFNENKKILTHASAINSHPSFDLVSAVDPSQERRILFEKRYNINAYESINDIPHDLKIDVFAVCTPTHLHLSSIAEIVDNFFPRCVLVEKPISDNYEQANSFFSHLEATSPTKIFVNYIRRSDYSSHVISQLIQNEDISFKVKGHCYYTKGAMNNASHFLNLLESWFGLSTLKPVSPYYPCEVEGDFNLDFIANFDNASIFFQSGVESIYSLYQLQLYLPSGILSYVNGGADIFYLSREFIPSKPTPYGEPWQRISSDLDKYQFHVYDEVFKALNGKPSMLSTKVDALNTLKSLSTLQNYPS